VISTDGDAAATVSFTTVDLVSGDVSARNLCLQGGFATSKQYDAININNSIIWASDNSGGRIYGSTYFSKLNVVNNYSDLTHTPDPWPASLGSWTDNSVLLEYPFWTNPAGGSYSLTYASPVVDAGWSGDPNLPATDFMGATRVQDGYPDMG